MDKKKKVLILGIIAFIVILIILKLFSTKSPEEKVTKYVTKSLGFSNTDGSHLYSKQNSKIDLDEYLNKSANNVDAEYEIVYFNTDTYELTMTNFEYKNGISKDFSPTYDYTTGKLTYTYRVNYDTINTIFEGSFDSENNLFYCKPIFAYNIDVNKTKVDICNKISVVVKDFDYYARTLIKNPDILESMKK